MGNLNQSPPPLPPQLPQPQQNQTQNNNDFDSQLNRYTTTNKKDKIPKWIIALICFGVLFTIYFMIRSSSNTENHINNATKEWHEKALKDSVHLSNGYYSADSMESLEIFVERYHELELMAIQNAPKEVTDTAIIKSANLNANKAFGILTDSISNYRNQFTKILKNKLWLDNIKVKTQDNGKTLWLIGGYFASNRKITEFQNEMEPMFKALGYKRICYKWADISSAEYTYYDL